MQHQPAQYRKRGRIETLSGSLYENKETAQAIAPGDYSLSIKAYSAEGIASIEVIANGSSLVDEKTCEQEWETPERECQTVESPWVTNTGNWPPGILNLEVVVTDANGDVESVKFWVNIPYTPPPDPEADEPPAFEDVLKFREEFGLDLDLKGDEQAIYERIFDLIGAWYNPSTPSGEIARATYERWGVPLRAVDAAELDYRDRYVSTDVSVIEGWAKANYPGTYTGYYVDHRAGGILHVGFTQNQSTRLAELKDQVSLEVEDRLAEYSVPPSAPQVSLGSAYEVLEAALDNNPTFKSLVTDLSINESEDELSIGTTNIPQTQAIVTELIGSQISVDIHSGAEPVLDSGRHQITGRMRAGDRIVAEYLEKNAWWKSSCTAGFGAYENRQKKSNEETVKAEFILTAGHCFPLGTYVYRSKRADLDEEWNWSNVGQVRRNAYHGDYATDGLAIRLGSSDLAPRGIFGSTGGLVPTGTPTKAKVGNILCYSGAKLDGVSCGEVSRKVLAKFYGVWVGLYYVKFRAQSDLGDSGAPVWNPRTGAAVGLITGHYENTQITVASPLLHPEGLDLSKVPGIIHDPDIDGIHLITRD